MPRLQMTLHPSASQTPSHCQDDIADVLEGNTEYDRTGDPVTEFWRQHDAVC